MATRLEKLEEAVRAGIRLRRKMRDLGEPVKNLFASRESVVEFDVVMADLADKKGPKGEFDDI